MKKRSLIALVLVLAVVLIAQTGAWAGKLQTGADAAPAAASNAGVRPAGTVTNEGGAIEGIVVMSEEENVTLVVLEISEDDMDLPNDDAFLVEVTFNGDSRELTVEFGPDGGEFYYWNGTEWVELEVTNGTVTIPADAADPVMIAVVPL